MAVAQIARSQGTGLRSNPGFVLRDDAAVAWDRAVAKFGRGVLLTGAWRSYETQVRLFTERYERKAWPFRGPYGDVRTWNGKRYVRVRGAAAAVPGTSNHGGGVAVDVKTGRSSGDPGRATAVVFTSWSDRDRVQFLRDAAEFGWDDAEGRRVNELWHLTYYPEKDKHRGKGASTSKPSVPASGKRKPTPPQTIRRGSQGFPVILLQRRLGGNGVYYSGVIDNDFGEKTHAAVRRFQRDRGLTVDGVVGPHTWYELAQGAGPGSSGEWRNRIAQRVCGLRGDEADGVIGPQSVERIRQVQRFVGVKDDGVLGPDTVEALKRKG